MEEITKELVWIDWENNQVSIAKSETEFNADNTKIFNTPEEIIEYVETLKNDYTIVEL